MQRFGYGLKRYGKMTMPCQGITGVSKATSMSAQLIQQEVICFYEYGKEVPNDNTQIPNNIKIINLNDQNIWSFYSKSRGHFICLEF